MHFKIGKKEHFAGAGALAGGAGMAGGGDHGFARYRPP